MSPNFGSKSINPTKDNTARHGRAIASLSEQQQRARLELKHAGTPLNHQDYDLVIQDPSNSGICMLFFWGVLVLRMINHINLGGGFSFFLFSPRFLGK